MSERERLARYVIPAERLRLEMEEPAQPRLEVIRAIYEAFCRRKLRYDIEPYNPDLGVQSIRQPDAILEESGKGTCLDLALLFAGECLGRGLLAVVIVVRGHALVAVASEYDLRSSVKPERNAFQKGVITKLETLKHLIEDQGFVPVECTGFVESTTNPEGVFAGIARNANGFLEFEDAVRIGHKQLETKDFRFALDVEYLHQNNHLPYDPKSEEFNALQEIKTILVARLEKPDDARVLAPPASRVKLFGRDADLERAQNALQTGQTVLVHGMGGIGKTALALEVAKRLHESKAFPDGVLWINEVGRADVTSICDAVARALGNDTIPKLAADDPLQRQQKLTDTRQLLESKRLMLILDDLGSPQTAREFLEHCLPANRGVLFTSRRADLEHQESIELETLPRADAKRLFEDRANQPVNDAIANDICEVLEDHPLALVIAAGRVRVGKMPPERLLERLRAVRLGTISQQGHRDKGDNVTVSIRVSFEDPTLTDDARTAFLNLSACFAETTGLELLSMLNETSESETEDRLEQLVQRSLVNREGDRYGLHALLRDYGRGELGDGFGSVQDRLLDCMVSFTESYREVTAENLDRLEGEIENIFKSLEYTENPEKSERILQIFDAVFQFLTIRGYWNERVKIGRSAVKLAKKINDLDITAVFTHNIAIALSDQGHVKEASLFYHQSFEIYQKLGNQLGIAISLHELGIIAQNQGDYANAREYYNQSLEIEQKIRNQSGIANSLHQLGMIAQSQGDYNNAREHYSQSLEINQALGNQSGIAKLLHQLGNAAQDKGNYDNAREYYNQSLEIKYKLGDQSGIAGSLHQLGNIAHSQGNYDDAREYYSQSLEIGYKLGNQSGIAGSLHQLGMVAQYQGNYDDAREYYSQSLEIEHKLGDQSGIANSLHQLGIIAYFQGDYDNAQEYHDQSLEILRKLGDQSGIASSLHQFGIINQYQGDYDAAQGCYNQSLEIKRKLGNQSGIAISLYQLGELAEIQGQTDVACQHYRQALEIFEPLKSPYAKTARQDLERLGCL